MKPLLERGWLSRQPADFQTDLLARSEVVNFAPGEAVFRIGDPPGGIYGLINGTLRVMTAPDHGAPRFLLFVLVGGWAGEGCFMTGDARRGEMKAQGECRMLHLPLVAMQQMAAADPEAIRRFATITVSHFDILVRVINDLMIPQADRRIASVLARTALMTTDVIPISQEELGAMSNTSRKQVNAALARFVGQGWVEASYRNVKVRDAAALQHHAESQE